MRRDLSPAGVQDRHDGFAVINAEQFLVRDAAQAALRQDAHCDPGVRVVTQGGDPRRDAFQSAEPGRLEPVVHRQCGFGSGEGAYPGEKGDIFEEAAQGGVFEVAVGVDQAGHQDGLAEPPPLIGGRLFRPDGGDHAVFNDHLAVLDGRGVNGQHPAGGINGDCHVTGA